MTRKKARPKFQIKAKPPHTSGGSGSGVADGNENAGPGSHPEVHGDGLTPSDTAGRRELSGNLQVAGRGEFPEVKFEHPKPRKGPFQPLPEKPSSGPDTLTLEGFPVGGGGESGGGGRGRKGERERGRGGGGAGGGEEKRRMVGKGSHTASALDFSDEDDILSGMGLDDNNAPHKSKTSLGGQMRGSRAAGATSSHSQPFQDMEEVKTSTRMREMGRDGENGKEEEEGGEEGEDKEEEGESYQFGGYLPSVVSDVRPTSPPSTESRRRRLPEHRTPFPTTSHSQHEPAPNLRRHHHLPPTPPRIPDPAQTEASKRSVRFSDETPPGTEPLGPLPAPSTHHTSDGRLKPALKTREREYVRETREQGTREQPSPVAEEVLMSEHVHGKGSAPDRTAKQEKTGGQELVSKNRYAGIWITILLDEV